MQVSTMNAEPNAPAEKMKHDEPASKSADAVTGIHPPTSFQPADLVYLKSLIRSFPHFPKPNIQFYDIFGLFQDPTALNTVIHQFLHFIQQQKLQVHVVVGLEARGFLFAPYLSSLLHCKFAPIRKPKKLPGQTFCATYLKEYGEDTLEIQADAILPGQSVIIVDDVIATGGSAKAAGDLVKKCGGNICYYLFVIELAELGGRKQLEGPVHSILTF